MRRKCAPLRLLRPTGCDLFDCGPEFFVTFFGDADLDAMRRRAVLTAMREFACDHAVAHDEGMQIVPVGPVLHAAADVGPMPAAHVHKPIGGVPMVIELAANPDDRAGLGCERRLVAIALAIFGRLEEAPLFRKERMLLDVRGAYVATFARRFHHQVERVAAGFNGSLDCVPGRLPKSCLSLRFAFHDAVRRAQDASRIASYIAASALQYAMGLCAAGRDEGGWGDVAGEADAATILRP